MKRNLLLCLGALLMAAGSFSQSFYCVQTENSLLLTIDISNGAIVDSISTEIASSSAGVNPIQGYKAMAKHPTSGDIYVVIKDDNNTRYLASLDVSSGQVTTIGQTTSTLSTLAFDAAGVLYGMNGGGSTSMVTVNTTTGASTLFFSWSTSENDGEALGFNTTDNLMYRYGGGSDGSLWSTPLTVPTETNIATFSGIDTYGGALAYRSGSNKFVLAMGESFYEVLPDGTFSFLSDISSSGLANSSYFKGLVRAVPSGIEVNESSADVSVYPNPSAGIFTIESKDNYVVKVLDISGKIIDVCSNVDRIKIETSGIYLLEFSNSNTKFTRKVVVK